MRARRTLTLIALAPLVATAGLGLYLLGLAGELPGQVAPTPISAGITPFAELGRGDPDSSPIASPHVSAQGANPNAATRYVFASGQSTVRYVVREKLAGVPVDSDAIGETNAVNGEIAVDAAGQPVPGTTFEVDLRLLKSDKVRRDNDVKKLFLETDTYPIAAFVLRDVADLSAPLSEGATVEGQAIGDLTAHGVTKSVTWQATATLQGDTLSGKATTSFTFADFDMPVPNIYGMVSARDPITLELEFTARRAG